MHLDFGNLPVKKACLRTEGMW